MDNVKVNINNDIIEVSRGTTLENLSLNYESNFKYPIILAKVNGIYQELTETIKKDCTIKFFDLTDRGANRVFLNGLIYLTIYAARNIFTIKNKLNVSHSLDKGLYIETSEKITKEDVDNLYQEMLNIVNKGLSINKVTVTRLDAIDYFNKIY